MQQVGLNHQVLQTEAVSAGRDHLSDRGCTNPPKDHMTESNSQETSGMITTQLLQLFYTAGQRCKLGLTVCDTIKKKKKDPYQGKTSFINFKNIYKNKNNNQ